MRKGWSGARIEVQENRVLKYGENLHTQAIYCRYLGEVVCPQIYDFTSSWYAMEKLDEPDPSMYPALLEAAKSKLEAEVWNKGEPRDGDSWRMELLGFCFCLGYNIGRFLDQLYPHSVRHMCIHGDPTLANMMIRKPGHVILIDPIRPRGKIPALREVDLGKMLQSAIGWEALVMAWPVDGAIAEAVILEGEGITTVRKAWFWCAVHLMRILGHGPYSDASIDSWCRDNIKTILERLDAA